MTLKRASKLVADNLNLGWAPWTTPLPSLAKRTVERRK